MGNKEANNASVSGDALSVAGKPLARLLLCEMLLEEYENRARASRRDQLLAR